MLTTLLNTLFESAPYVVLGFLIAGVLRFYVPQNVLQRHLGRGSSFALFKSVGIGSMLPLCSCGTIPLGIGLFRNGASVGNMLAFMTSTPILSPVLIAVALKLLGASLTSVLVISSVVGSFIIGFIGNRLFKNRKEEAGSATCRKDFRKIRQDGLNRKTHIKTLRWSFFEFGADVSVDIVIGLGLAALLLSYLPLEWISTWLGQQDVYTLLYVILLGLPVYACSIPSVGVVQGLLLLGATPGAAIAYMIAGPATNLGELNAIRRSMGLKPSLFYAMSLIVLALAAGMVTDQWVFPDYQYHAFRVGGQLEVKQCCVPLIFGEGTGSVGWSDAIPLWHWPFGFLLSGIIGYGIFIKTKYFLVNPCKACTWRVYGKDGVCNAKCHVRRKYEMFTRIRNWFRPAI